MSYKRNMKGNSIIKQSVWREITFFVAMYALRTLFFIGIKILDDEYTLNTYRKIIGINNFIVEYIWSLFQIYFTISMVLSENIYGYYIAIIIMIHNCILSILVLVYAHLVFRAIFWIPGIVIASTYVVESVITFIFIRIRRAEATLSLFRKIGADPAINEMYSTRKKLETLGSTNLIISIIMAERLFIPPVVVTTWTDRALVIGTLIVTFIQQILIFSCMYEERLIQRITAIVVTGIKCIISLTLLIVVPFIYTYSSQHYMSTVRPILYADELIISLLFLYYLVMDTRNFGRGLASSLKNTEKQLVLGHKDYI